MNRLRAGAPRAMLSRLVVAVPKRASAAIGFRPLHVSARRLSQKPGTVKDVSARLRAVRERREEAGKLMAGVAAYSDSDMFKGSTARKPKAKRWDSHFSKECQNRQPCILKQAAKHMKKPGLISLGGGLPSPTYFPISELSYRLAQPPSFSLDHLLTASVGKFDMTERSSEYDLSVALNYGQAQGSAQMLRWITEHAEVVHNPPYADWGCAASSGSTGALEIAVRMFCNGLVGGEGVEGRGRDRMLVEEYSFSTAVETMEALGVDAVSVKMDAEGLVPEVLDGILMGWDVGRQGRRPHVLYTVPSGQNPTGATQGAERRQRIYDVCEKHDIFIIEDEPYYFLQMPPFPSTSSPTTSSTSPTSSPPTPQSYLSTLTPTYPSLDQSGRVLRLDSFSKVLVPGARMGFVTGPSQVVERFVRYMESAQGPSGFSQAALHTILDSTWGHEGYFAWLARVSAEYARRRDVLVRACEEELPGVVKWVVPRAGMFMWLKVDHTQHPHKQRSILEIEEEIFNSCIDKGVLVARGSWFRADKSTEPSELFFRVTYAMAGEDTMREAVRRLGAAIRESFGM